MDNLVLLKEFRGHYWQMTTAQGWAAWVFGWKRDSHQNCAVTPPERQKEAAQIYRVFWLRFTVGGSRKESFIFIYVKVWNARECFQPIRHSYMSNIFEIFWHTSAHWSQSHLFFLFWYFRRRALLYSTWRKLVADFCKTSVTIYTTALHSFS